MDTVEHIQLKPEHRTTDVTRIPADHNRPPVTTHGNRGDLLAAVGREAGVIT